MTDLLQRKPRSTKEANAPTLSYSDKRKRDNGVSLWVFLFWEFFFFFCSLKGYNWPPPPLSLSDMKWPFTPAKC